MKPKSSASHKLIAIDFDGTCVTHEYPKIGRDIGAVPVLKELVAKGHQLALWTMRSGKYLQDAIDWFNQNKIPLAFANSNPEQKEWTDSPKFYAHLYIDDAALGAPLTGTGERPYYDWYAGRELLVDLEIL